jgi:WD40 repeat protein
VNLTKAFDLNIRQAHFSGNNANTLFAKTDDALRRLDVGSTTASGALVAGVRDFTVYGEDTIAFTAIQEKKTGDSTTGQQQIGVYRGGKITPVRELPVDQQAKISYNEYDNHDYLAISSANSSTVDIVRDATGTGTSKEAAVYAHFDLGATVSALSFSNNGRMVTAQHGNMIATYDIETAKTYTRTLGFGSDKTAPFKWLDDYYLWSDDGGKLRIFEFDGTNDHELTTTTPGYDIMLSSNGKRLLSVGRNDVSKKMLLQDSKLTIDN